jgi:predicted metal-dependent hydrolase
MQVTLNNTVFTIIHHTNKKIKRVSLVLQSQSEIVIKTPLKFKAHKIKEIVYQHQEWILSTLENKPIKSKFEFVTGGELPYLGKKYPLKLLSDKSVINVKFIFEEECFIVKHNPQTNTYEEFMEGLKQFYKFNAPKVINPLVENWSHKMELFPNKLGYRFAKTRWGSCSSCNNISLNYMLLQFDIEVIEYVVVHELSHITHKNHSSKFWSLVSYYLPHYKKLEQQMGYSLLWSEK